MLKEKEFYKEKIVEMVKEINRTDILNYIYIVISDIIKDRNIGNE